MKLSALIEDLEVLSTNASLECEISGISYDSRLTQPGHIFVAIKGLSSDGHRFIPTAMEKGAAVVLCEDLPAESSVPYVQVKDCRRALALLSGAWYGHPAREMTIIGITGTSGKTTSSYLIKHMLEEQLGAKVGLVGTNGNMIGQELIHTEFTTPESLELHALFRRMADGGCKYVVMEVSSHSLHMERVAGVDFHTALFTNLSQDHLDLHKTMDEYAAAKKKIFSMCRIGCVNADDTRAAFMMEGEGCEFLTFSAEGKGKLNAENIRLSAGGVDFTAAFGAERCETTLCIPGMFSVHNALGAIAVGLSLGLSLEACCASIRTAKGVKGRMELVPSDGDYSILIDYSHKPDALENVLKTLRPVTRGRLIVLFGCGGDRDRLKRPIMADIAADNADLVVVTSDNPRTEDPEAIIDEIMVGFEGKKTPVIRICDRIEAIHAAIDNARAGDVILLAGKGHEDYQIVGHTKHHMDEREIVAAYLEERKRS